MFKKFKDFNEAIEYGENTPKMNPDLEKKLKDKEHLYKNHQAFPEKDAKDNFGEKIASKRYMDLVDKIRHYAGLEHFNITSLTGTLMQALMRTISIEKTHKKDLEKLAIKLVMEQLNVPKGSLQFKAEIKGIGEIDLSDITKKLEEEEEEAEEENKPSDIEIQATEIFIDQNAEDMKRRFINGLVQGSANKGHYMFHLAEKELNAIDDDLINLYGTMITANDLNYWLWSDTMISQAGEDESGAGKVRIDMSTEPPTIHTQGINFPTLVHELVKGVMEYLSLYGLPTSDEVRRKTLAKNDFLDSEMWDLRFGPELWNNFIGAIDFKELDIKEVLYAHIVEMPAKEFNQFMRDLMEGNDVGKKKMQQLANDIRNELKREDFEEAVEKGKNSKFDEDDIDEDDVDLSDLGF